MISVQTEDFDAGAEIEHLIGDAGQVGAVVSFVGVVRGGPEDDPLLSMTLEHYPGMTEKALATIEAEARTRWPLTDTLIVHRVGTLKPGDRIVLVVTASAHRKAAFEAVEFLMDYLKTKAPFWKREVRPSGATWVEGKDTDAAAAGRWA
jgi:molybdopterin synthase catalytic subunit